jgi:hypothetical protein
MKLFLSVLFIFLSHSLFADEACSVAIKDRFGVEYEVLTRTSYSRDAACNEAIFACQDAIRYGQTYGRYYDAFCEIKMSSPVPPHPPRPPFPPTGNAMCTTDLMDSYGSVLRSFTGNGRNEREACAQSEEFCRYELSRHDSYGRYCLTRGGHNPPTRPPSRPPRQTTEQCLANRHDPAGYFIESYSATFTGPVGTDVKGEACRRAYSICSSELRGRQTCQIAR